MWIQEKVDETGEQDGEAFSDVSVMDHGRTKVSVVVSVSVS
jgi:hypothetical protein